MLSVQLRQYWALSSMVQMSAADCAQSWCIYEQQRRGRVRQLRADAREHSRSRRDVYRMKRALRVPISDGVP
jgi:hypothetical protein